VSQQSLVTLAIIKILLQSFLRFLRQSDKFGRSWHIFVTIVCERGTTSNSQRVTTSSGEFKKDPSF